MNNDHDYPYDYPTYQEPKPKRRRRWRTPALIAGAGVAGLVIGSAATAGAEPEVVTETVTETVEVEVEAEPEVITETVTEEVEVEVTPQACTDAIEEADELIDVYSEALMISSEAIEAAFEWDSARLDELTEQLGALHEDRLDPALAGYYLNTTFCGEEG